MRVLHLHSGNLYGGVETLLVTLWHERHTQAVIEPQYALSFEGRLSRELRASGATVHALGGVRVRAPLSVRRGRRRLAELLRHGRFDLVACHAPWPHAIFAPVVRRAGLPLVFWMHAPADGRHWLERWARLHTPDLVICNSSFTSRTAPQLFPDTRAEILYCPVGGETPLLSADEKARLRASLDTPPGDTVIVQVGRLEPLKGHRQHLQALAALKGLNGWTCWMVGGAQRAEETAYAAELKAQAARLGIADRVRFIGERTDVARLLAASDIYCQPNTQPESFGLTFIEALRASVPIVTTKSGGALEIIDSTCGRLVAPNDDASLAATLRELIASASLRNELGKHGPARARKLCDPAKQMARLRELFESVARHRAAA